MVVIEREHLVVHVDEQGLELRRKVAVLVEARELRGKLEDGSVGRGLDDLGLGRRAEVENVGEVADPHEREEVVNLAGLVLGPLAGSALREDRGDARHHLVLDLLAPVRQEP